MTATELPVPANRISPATAVLVVALPLLAFLLVYAGAVRTEYLRWSAGGAGLLFLVGRPSRGLIALSLVAGLALWPLMGPPTLASAVGSWGVSGMALAGLRLPWADARACAAALGAMIWPITLVVWITFRYHIGLRQPTLDALLFAWDAKLGMPAYTVGRLVHGQLWPHGVLRTIYQALPFLTAIPYALLHLPGDRTRLLVRYYVASLVGLGLYTVVPGCGPIYVDPAFPSLPALPIALPLELPDHFERNAIPSLHLTGGLLAWWAMPRWQWLGLLWTLGTAVATLALGEHYAVDLLIALPFAAMWHAASERRWKLAAWCAALTVVWVVGLRGTPPPTPLVFLLAAASLALVWVLRKHPVIEGIQLAPASPDPRS